METVSVIIPCRNEESFIAECLESVINNDYPRDSIEVLVIDGKSMDKTQKIIKEYSSKYGFIRLLINEKYSVPHAMNLGIQESKGEYIIRLDAHSKIPKNYFSQLIIQSKKLGADNIGVVCITDVKHKNSKSNSIKIVLSNKFGVGNSLFRTGINNVREVDTVPFGCYKKEVFDKIGYFDTRLVRNQDIELNKRIKRIGGKVILLPNLFCTYYARETFLGIAKNNFQTGLWNILTVYLTKHFDSLSLRHFIPLVFVLSLLFPIILMVWEPFIGFISVISLICYLLILLTVSFKLNNKNTKFYLIVFSFLALHFSYGFGSFTGLFRLNYLLKKNEELFSI